MKLQRLMNGTQKSFSSGFLKLETCALLCTRIPRIYSVVQSAGGADDWNRAVFQAVNLIESARLVPRRHEEHIGASFDLVGESIVVRDPHCNFVGNLTAQTQKHFFVKLVATAQDGEQNVLECKAVHYLANQIEAFLCGETRDNSNQRDIGIGIHH